MVTGLLILLGLAGAQAGADDLEARRLGTILAEIAHSDLNLRKGRGQCVSTSLADPSPGDLKSLATSYSSKMPSRQQSRFLKEVKRLGSARPLGNGWTERARADALRAAFPGAMSIEVRLCSSLATISMPVLTHGKTYFFGRWRETCSSSSFRGSLSKSKSGWKMEYFEYFNSMQGPPGCLGNNPEPLTSAAGALLIGEK
jgi:hypothetical protein